MCNDLSRATCTAAASGQAPQGIAYIPNAVSSGDGMSDLVPLGEAATAGHLLLGSIGKTDVLSTAKINSQALVDIIQAAVAGLEAKQGDPNAESYRTAVQTPGPRRPLGSFREPPRGPRGAATRRSAPRPMREGSPRRGAGIQAETGSRLVCGEALLGRRARRLAST
jgi:hypothetical protein